MRVDLSLKVDIQRSARVAQVEGMFDVPEKKMSAVEYHFDVPLEERSWQVGLVVGPSGAGKSSVARALFGDKLVEGYAWEHGRAVVDGFGPMPIKDVVGALSAVGFASPPSWLKPYHVLSNGEKFRVNLARAIADPAPLVAVDEFSSVVDRQVARIGAHATAKAVRAKPGKQFVAVTCHEDVLEWLQPDWVLEPHIGQFSWRSPQRRPTVELEIVRTTTEAWRWFAAHHYLSADLNRVSKCFLGLVDGDVAAFAALLPSPHPIAKNIWRVHRVVVRPDYQGLGLGAHAFTGALGRVCRAVGKRMTITTSHPALVRAWAKSSEWKMTAAPALGKSHGVKALMRDTATRRRVASFEYVGPAFAGDEGARARTMWQAKTAQ
jgi:ABC-type thiamine transport system ATPase subunit